MKAKNYVGQIIVALLICFIATPLSAQTDLQSQYSEFYDKSSTWEDYKMIKNPRLDDFWAIVTDSLNEKQSTISQSATRISEIEASLKEATAQISTTQAELNASQAINDSISFIGIPINKVVYHFIVWGIIFGLVAAVGVVFMMFKRSNVVTQQSKRDLQTLEGENQMLRDKARDTQIKLKRELQTALNALNEQRV